MLQSLVKVAEQADKMYVKKREEKERVEGKKEECLMIYYTQMKRSLLLCVSFVCSGEDEGYD